MVAYFIRTVLFYVMGSYVRMIITGVVGIPLGILVIYMAVSGEYIFFYWVGAGAAISLVGLLLVIRGSKGLMRRRKRAAAPVVGVGKAYADPSQSARESSKQ